MFLVRLISSFIPFSSFLGPAFQFTLDGIKWYLSRLWEGAKDIFDNPATILTVISIVVVTHIYTERTREPVPCPTAKTKSYKEIGRDRFREVFKPVN